MPEARAAQAEAPEAPKPAETVDRKVWRNVAGLVGGNTLGEVLGLVVHAQIIQILGPGGFGRLAQAQAVVDVSDGIAAFGLNQVGPALGVDFRERLGAYLGTLLAFRAGITALVLGLVLLLAPLLQATEPGLVRLAAAALLFAPLGNTASVPFFLRQENWRVAWVPGAVSLLNIGLLVLVLVLAPTVPWVIAANLAARAAQAVLLSELARRRYGFRYTLDRGVARHLLRVGPKAAWLDVVVILYSKASYFVLDGLGSVLIGLYAVADRIAAPFLRVSGAFSASALPMFAELGAARDVPALRGFYLRNLRRMGLGLAAIAALIYLGVPPVIRAWFPAYEGSLPVLYVLYLGVCFMAVNQMTSSCLNGLGHFGWVAVVATINLCVYALGAWLWVGRYGAVGAALATTVMEGCNMLMQLGLLTLTLRMRAREARA